MLLLHCLLCLQTFVGSFLSILVAIESTTNWGVACSRLYCFGVIKVFNICAWNIYLVVWPNSGHVGHGTIYPNQVLSGCHGTFLRVLQGLHFGCFWAIVSLHVLVIFGYLPLCLCSEGMYWVFHGIVGRTVFQYIVGNVPLFHLPVNSLGMLYHYSLLFPSNVWLVTIWLQVWWGILSWCW